jgi:SOS-response transcriptional repressor LexA
MKTMGDRLKEARNDFKIEAAREAAIRFGWTVSTYSAHENGQNGFGEAAAKKYARAYGVMPGWLLTGEGPKHPPRSPRDETSKVVMVPVLDWVSAGKLTEPGSQIPVEDVPLLAFADLGRGEFFALRVDGTSMDRISPHGSIIVVNRADRHLVAGKPYVFSLRGAATYKLWHPGDPAYLEPSSWDSSNKPIFFKRRSDVEVVGRVRRTLMDL